jgi:hypothetical protein
MERPFDIITFDCYGTLIDWESGIAGAFLDAAQKDGIVLQRDEVLRAYEHHEPIVEHEQYRRYRDVLALTALRVAQSLDWPLAHGTFLPESLPRWKPFADTNRALERLRTAGYRLGILSNVDDDLLSETRKHFTVDFDLIITALLQASARPLRRRERTHRLSAMAPRCAKQLPRHRAGECDGSPDGVGQSPRGHTIAWWHPHLRGPRHGGTRRSLCVNPGSLKVAESHRPPPSL